jgi:hypothetical protein
VGLILFRSSFIHDWQCRYQFLDVFQVIEGPHFLQDVRPVLSADFPVSQLLEFPLQFAIREWASRMSSWMIYLSCESLSANHGYDNSGGHGIRVPLGKIFNLFHPNFLHEDQQKGICQAMTGK